MADNKYLEDLQRGQQSFGQGTAGAGAFRAAYDRLKAEAEARKQGIGSDYASAYQQLRGQTYAAGLGGAARGGLSGGQGAMVGQRIGAAQMGQLGTLLQGQEKALREQKVAEQGIYSNALLEGQQAQQYQQQQQAAESARQEKTQSILDNTNLDDAGKTRQLKALGYSDAEISNLLNPKSTTSNYAFAGFVSGSPTFYKIDENGNSVRVYSDGTPVGTVPAPTVNPQTTPTSGPYSNYINAYRGSR